jgi:PKD repeat protein
MAGSFTPGNLVVCRVGDGSQTLTNTGNSVFLDEYTTAGTYVQSIMLPTNYNFGANSPLLLPGSDYAGGLISLSQDGRFILVAGYGATLGQLTNYSLISSYSTQVPRVIALVDAQGNIDTTTAQTNSLASGEDFRSAASPDGTNLWFGGDTSSVRYTTRGSALATQLGTGVANVRQVNIFSNQVYFSDASGSTFRLATAGPGLPTTSGQIYTNLPGLPTSGGPWSFAFLNLSGGTNAVDTLYVADSTVSPNGVLKYSLVGGTWVSNGTIEAYDAFGVAASVQISGHTTNVNLYISANTDENGGDTIYTWTDPTGYNGNIPPGSDADDNIIVISGPAQSFRGIVFAPTGGEVPPGPGQLSVGPILGFFSTGMTGCSDPDTQNYYLANPGTDTVSWAASADQNWVSLTPPSGSLSSGGTVTVAASFNTNVTSLTTGTNTATITFTNTTSALALGTTTRAVQVILVDQKVTPSSSFNPTGKPGGPFSPANQVYTLSTGGTTINWTASKTANWINLSATNGSLAGCAATNITVSLNASANALAAGFYTDTITFSNADAGTEIDSRSVTLSSGYLFWSDNFSTFNSGNLNGQNGWLALGSQPYPLQVTNGAVVDPGLNSSPGTSIKNFPLSSNTVFLGMVVSITSARTNAAPYYITGLYMYNGGTMSGGYADYRFTARSTNGLGNVAFGVESTGQSPWAFGTTTFPTGTPVRVIIQTDPLGTNTWLYVNPTDAVLSDQTPYAVATLSAGNAVDIGVGSFGIAPYGTAAEAGDGALFYTIAVSTNYADVYNGITPPAAPSAGFNASAISGTAPFTVHFTDTSSGSITNWFWNFGDGNQTNFAARTSPTHTYATGTYTVTQTVSGPGGSASNQVTITSLDPFAAWQQLYFGCNNCSNAAANADPLGKGISNTNQFLLGLNPTNPASVFRITSVVQQGTNVTVTWSTAGVRTNVVQGAAGVAAGCCPPSYGYSNNFTDISGGIILNVAGDTSTNYVDQSGTNHYYRIRLGP